MWCVDNTQYFHILKRKIGTRFDHILTALKVVEYLFYLLTRCYFQLTSSVLDSKLRDDLERLKKIRAHRGMRHYWG
ncbi:unnamed protein product [Nesidiocoris tenuis]|uniref:Small ribosomal subunit protein uS13 n=1 Tax=Nesidiocoris tenuis TaxID=355587 RepID=A0A6H5H330_9HEMI|nr:unnamed protein product [Nesidiocoris tenuis]